MDLQDTIRQLEIEKERIEITIAELEQLQNGGGSGVTANHRKSNRGRKSMGSDERKVVSERMKRYWAKQRQTRSGPTLSQ
jgi:hypothetical protein